MLGIVKRWAKISILPCVLLAACGGGPRETALGVSEEKSVPDTRVADPTPFWSLRVTPTEPEVRASTPTMKAAAATPSLDAEALRQEWRPAIQRATLLFETCTLMYETHFEFSREEIGLERALQELDAEGDVLALVWRGFTSGPVPSDATGPYMFRLEGQIMMLIGLLDPIDQNAIGTPEVQETLFDVCAALEGLQAEIVSASIEAGLAETDVEEIGEEVAPLLEDLYEQFLGN